MRKKVEGLPILESEEAAEDRCWILAVHGDLNLCYSGHIWDLGDDFYLCHQPVFRTDHCPDTQQPICPECLEEFYLLALGVE